MNVVHLLGRLGADPETRYTASGKAVANLRLATDEYGGGEKRTEWHRIVCFDKTAEVCAEYLTKGAQCCVEGRLQTRKWEKDGRDVYTTEVVAHRVHFVGKPAQMDAPKETPKPAPKQDEVPESDFDDDFPY